MSEAILSRHAREIFASSLQACSVERAYERKLKLVHEGGRSLVRLAGETLDLTPVRHLQVVSAGKAGAEMLMGFLSRVPFHAACEIAGVLIARSCPADLPQGIKFFAGGHPLPNQASFDGARGALEAVRQAAACDNALVLCFISGGASAMMELPLAPEISLEDTADFYQSLVHSGATIAEINCIRKHFSAVKGGRLALAAGATPILTLLVSDVPPEHLDSLASGPTIPDPTTIVDCRHLLTRHEIDQTLPASIHAYFASPALQETPKLDNLTPRLAILLSSDDLAEAAERAAVTLGYHVVFDQTCDDWPYDKAAAYLLDRARVLRSRHPRLCLVSAGEVTVPVPAALQPGVPHAGGRNQHLALYLASLLTQSDHGIAFLSAGSDGVDGNSTAAGAVIDQTTLGTAQKLQQARQSLQQFDSSTFLASCGATVMTGATGNNLRDLRILLAETDPHANR